MANYAIGLDFGTNSCRSVIINVDNGDELSTSVYNYPSGELGIITDKSDPNVARQNPQDYIQGLEQIIKESLEGASNSFSDFNSALCVSLRTFFDNKETILQSLRHLFVDPARSSIFCRLQRLNVGTHPVQSLSKNANFSGVFASI